MSKYLMVSFFGGLIGAGCVLIVVYVTNGVALDVKTSDVNAAVASLHSRINDFYIFAGIVITLLLAINVGVYVKAGEEVDKLVGQHEKQIEKLNNKGNKLLKRLKQENDD